MSEKLTDELETNSYFVEGTYEQAEEHYLQAKSEFAEIIEASLSVPSVNSSIRGESVSIHSKALPKISLPKFNGLFQEWVAFRDLFLSMVGASDNLSGVEKMHYLKSSLTGDAARVIASIPITEDNYERAWKKLEARYENKSALIHAQFDILTALKPLTRKSGQDLERLRCTVAEVVESLDALGGQNDAWDLFLVHFICQRLDTESHEAWEMKRGNNVNPPKYAEICLFLEARVRALESLDAKSSSTSSAAPRSSKTPVTSNVQPTRRTYQTHVARASGCKCCGSAHYIASCQLYQRKTPAQRMDLVKSKGLCTNCLGPHRPSDFRSAKRCLECGSPHHTSLHASFRTNSQPTNGQPSGQQPPRHSVEETFRPTGSRTDPAQVSAERLTSDRSAVSNHVTTTLSQSKETILATALVAAVSPQGYEIEARALFDQGSQLSFVRESLVRALHLPRQSSSIALLGIGAQKNTTTRGSVQVRLRSLTNPSSQVTLEAHVLSKVTSRTPAISVTSTEWPHLSNLDLADPTFHTSGPVDILLGADVYGQLLEDGLRKGGLDDPVAQRTTFGWIISGPALRPAAARTPIPCGLTCSVDPLLQEAVQKFWAQESIPAPKDGRVSKEDAECETHFVRTHLRDATGRYIVRLPFKRQPVDLGESRSIAERMLKATHRRFKRDLTFRDLYAAFLSEYSTLGHMKLADSERHENAFFLPHHGVMRESSATTKLRVVFNGSQKTDTGHSLNDFLHAGPKVQTDLVDVLVRWRLHPYAFSADIEKMYRQIEVHPRDRKYQCILWSDNSDSPSQAYQLSTVTYGLSCAPFLAIRVLRQLANDEGETFPLAADAMRNNIYVDDLLSGASTISEAQEKIRQIDKMLKRGGFLLQKWASNVDVILDPIESARQVTTSKPLEEDGTILRALGLSWNPRSDAFLFTFLQENISVVSPPTKRSVLSVIARLFDPLGWLSPVIIKAKIFIQKLWKLSLQWDDPLPDSASEEWEQFFGSLHANSSVLIPRWLGTGLANNCYELHGFSDASQDALSAVVYVRVLSEDLSAATSLLTAKTKVAPIKRTTIARLELSAAVLLAQLVEKCQVSLDMQSTATFLWTDSSVTLAWIKGNPEQWKDFVGNRVALIHELVPGARWRHVSGADNPADVASRGLSPDHLQHHPLWWHGPSWLADPSPSWPDPPATVPEDVNLEERLSAITSTTTAVTTWDFAERHSSLHRLLRVTAYVRRAATLFRRKKQRSHIPRVLTPTELEEALTFWIRHVQNANFKQEIGTLHRGDTLPKASPLTRLTPFLDQEGVLRVGGRLKNSTVDFNAKHPAVLPRRCHLSSLIIDDIHRRTLHGGIQLTLSTVRQNFWIIGGRAPIRSFTLRCVKCSRHRGEAAKQMMGQLPALRTTPSRPFLHSGVDYAGPFLVKSWKGRGAKTYKAYLVVFECFSTSAVHLELTSDYTTEGFLAAYRRFSGRRGVCASITNDCGTNLVGADAELRRLFNQASKEFAQLRETLAADRTAWRFNPPSAPHFGGKWEAAVKSTKFHLKRIVGESVLTYEEFSGLLAQIEGVLNSRPLCPLSDDPNDISALTPGHFLTGAPINSIPEPSLSHLPESRLSRWQKTTQMVEHFWNRWSKEYLQRLQAMSKWNRRQDNLVQGSLVLVIDERCPPSRWPLARVVAVHRGPDGLVRIATVRTAARAQFQRPVVKLCPLPVPVVDDNNA